MRVPHPALLKGRREKEGGNEGAGWKEQEREGPGKRRDGKGKWKVEERKKIWEMEKRRRKWPKTAIFTKFSNLGLRSVVCRLCTHTPRPIPAKCDMLQ